MGLSLARTSPATRGGLLTVESSPRRGTAVHARLPLKPRVLPAAHCRVY